MRGLNVGWVPEVTSTRVKKDIFVFSERFTLGILIGPKGSEGPQAAKFLNKVLVILCYFPLRLCVGEKIISAQET